MGLGNGPMTCQELTYIHFAATPPRPDTLRTFPGTSSWLPAPGAGGTGAPDFSPGVPDMSAARSLALLFESSAAAFSIITWYSAAASIAAMRSSSFPPDSTISRASSSIASVASDMASDSSTMRRWAAFWRSSASLVRTLASTVSLSAETRSGRATSVIFCAAAKLILRAIAVCADLTSLKLSVTAASRRTASS